MTEAELMGEIRKARTDFIFAERSFQIYQILVELLDALERYYDFSTMDSVLS